MVIIGLHLSLAFLDMGKREIQSNEWETCSGPSPCLNYSLVAAGVGSRLAQLSTLSTVPTATSLTIY